ncbi:hypothetical protein IJ541_08890 [bacterium]|nr:hypothetical protein [bacterium]MBQ9245996.1 hypothetical protein [bacterium]MBQ9246901.1 hypothetical protein [bacterium]
MGMAASQARLLSITARLSNNEMEQQSLAYSKQRLSDNSEQINDAYLEALNKTKYQVLTGYNNSQANYADLTYSQITGSNTVATGKQYLVKSKDGQVLVSSKIASAYKKNNGDFNRFLRDLGYTQSDIDVSKYSDSEEAVHNAWDRYLAAVGKSIDNIDSQHILNFGYNSFSTESYDGYPTYDTAYISDSSGEPEYIYRDDTGYYKERYTLGARTVEDAYGNISTIICYQTADQQGTEQYTEVTGAGINYNTETKKFSYINEYGETVDADALYIDPNENFVSESYKNYLTFDGEEFVSEGGLVYDIYKESRALNYEGTTQAQRELYDYATAITEALYCKELTNTANNLTYDAQMVTYYKNIFNEMTKNGYTTLAESYGQKLATTVASDTMSSESKVFQDPDWFVKQLKAGNLTLSYFSTVEKSFINTTLDDDESITEREDTTAMAIAEQVYQNQMDKIESQDKQIDLQLNKLESEHNALQTEYEAVKKVISTNVDKSFNIFNA